MRINEKAAALRTKLHNLTNDFKDLSLAIRAAGLDDEGQADLAACALATVHQNLGDLFIDAYRDEKDQAFTTDAHGQS